VDSPWKKEDCLHIKYYKKESKYIIPDIKVRKYSSTRGDTAFIGYEFLIGGIMGCKEFSEEYYSRYEYYTDYQE
jgi:hypothetical protein